MIRTGYGVRWRHHQRPSLRGGVDVGVHKDEPMTDLTDWRRRRKVCSFRYSGRCGCRVASSILLKSRRLSRTSRLRARSRMLNPALSISMTCTLSTQNVAGRAASRVVSPGKYGQDHYDHQHDGTITSQKCTLAIPESKRRIDRRAIYGEVCVGSWRFWDARNNRETGRQSKPSPPQLK
jgi:hypothetical protein